jgi:hypothetical protein
MAGLVEELQREALDPKIPVSALLRKVKLVAVKLQLPEAVDWADAELKGYDGNPPDYRVVGGQIKSFHPYYGWRTMGGDPHMVEILSSRPVRDSISSLEALVDKSARGDGGSITISLPQELINSINEANGVGYHDIALHIGDNAFVAIIDRVRNIVFDWALDLEKAGITGEGISFTMAEKEKATSANITIGEVHGNVHAGDFTGGQQRNYSASTDNSVNVSDSSDVFSEASEAIKSGVTDTSAQAELLSLLESMKSAKNKPEFPSLYTKFIQAAGDHMKVVGPFIGAFTALLAS